MYFKSFYINKTHHFIFHLQLVLPKHYQPYTIVFSQSELVEEKEILKGQSETIEGKPLSHNFETQFASDLPVESVVRRLCLCSARASGTPVGTAGRQGSLLVINFDLEPECPDAELRATLQWIAASELGIPTIYFKKSQENRIEKVPCPLSGCHKALCF